MHSEDGIAQNIDRIAQLFPNCITEIKTSAGDIERAVDFDKLKAELSCPIAEGNTQRYQFTWPDKLEASRLANTPTTSCLRPCRDESVDFDHTQNLYIEGDNLEVLKVLRHTYSGKVKMIYIDPPYNTGKDFVYEDNFTCDHEEFLLRSGQKNECGQRLVVNTESNGRFHTDWLNMIYPRLKLARELLSDDGVIFISMDDHESFNLRKVCDEIFGESNFIAQLVVKRTGGRQDSSHFALHHEYILCYSRNKYSFVSGKESYEATGFNLFDESRKDFYKLQLLRKWGNGCLRSDRPNLFYPIKGPSGEDIFPLIYEKDDSSENNVIAIESRWRWKKEVMQQAINDGYVEFKLDEYGNTIPYERLYKSDSNSSKLYSTWIDTTLSGTSELKTLFKKSPFNYPKSFNLLKKLCYMADIKNSDIVLDFFSGSATTAHAVMHMNATDGGNRKFIMVQLPEELSQDSEGYKDGYKNICEIGKERIRRAGAAIKEEFGEQAAELDIGFRVLKLDSSNMKDTYYVPAKLTMASLIADNLKEDRTSEDLLFQALLETDVLLSEKIERLNIGGKEVFSVSDGFVMACFDNELDMETIKEIASKQPSYFITRYESFNGDALVDNLDQIFAAYSSHTIVKII